MDDSRDARARERRARISLRKTDLGDESDPWPVSGEKAISLLTELSLQAWALSGAPMPTYSRATIPCRFLLGPPT